MDSDLLKIEDFSPILKQRNNTYHFIVFELNLISSGKSVDASYDDLRKRYDVLIKEMKAAGTEHLLPQPEENSTSWYAPRQAPSSGSSIKSFIIKLAIVLVLIGGVVGAGAMQLKQTASGVQASLRQLDERAQQALRPIHALDRLASKVDEIPPERLEEIRQNVRKIVTRVAPIAEELRPLTDAVHSRPPQRPEN